MLFLGEEIGALSRELGKKMLAAARIDKYFLLIWQRILAQAIRTGTDSPVADNAVCTEVERPALLIWFMRVSNKR